MTNIDLDKLEALADAAGGKVFWTASKSGRPEYKNVSYFIYDGPNQLAEMNGDLPHVASFIEGCSPATIKSLIASAREAAAEIERLTGVAEGMSAAISWLDYPFIDNNTSEDELRSRVGFMMKDAEKHREALGRGPANPPQPQKGEGG